MLDNSRVPLCLIHLNRQLKTFKGDLDESQRSLDLCKEELMKKESELERTEEELGQRTSELTKCFAQLAARDDELLMRNIELARRDDELSRRDGELALLRDELARAKKDLTQRLNEIAKERQELEAKSGEESPKQDSSGDAEEGSPNATGVRSSDVSIDGILTTAGVEESSDGAEGESPADVAVPSLTMRPSTLRCSACGHMVEVTGGVQLNTPDTDTEEDGTSNPRLLKARLSKALSKRFSYSQDSKQWLSGMRKEVDEDDFGEDKSKGHLVSPNHQLRHEASFKIVIDRRSTAQEMWHQLRWTLTGNSDHSPVWNKKFSAGLADLFDRSAPSFEGAAMGMYELAENLARDFEFNKRAQDLMEQCKAEIIVKESRKTIFDHRRSFLPDTQQDLEEEEDAPAEEDLQKAMVAMYDAAFSAAGGQHIAQRRFDEANQLLRDHRRARGVERARQDPGFEILGIDTLYAATIAMQSKLEYEVRRISCSTHGEPICPPLKGRDRARAKILTKYGNDVACLTDVMRASIIYPDINTLYDALRFLIEEDLYRYRRDFYIVELNDRFQVTRDGYRDISILFCVDGMIGEVQLHVRQILDAKKGGGHSAYKKKRVVNELMFEACVRNNELKVMALAQEYKTCALGVRDKNGRSALHYCCQHGSEKNVRVLLEFKADPWKADDKGLLPYELALRMGHFDALELVLEHMLVREPNELKDVRRIVEFGALWWCDRMGHESDLPPPGKDKDASWREQSARKKSVFNAIESLGGKRNDKDALSAGERWRNVGKRLLKVITHHKVQQPLEKFMLEAAENGDLLKVCTLLEADFDVPLHPGQPSVLDIAIRNGHRELVSTLCDFAALGRECCQTSTREPPHKHLKQASIEEDAQQAIAALTAKADPNHHTARAPGKRTALMAFAAAGDIDTCKALLEHRAQLGWMDKYGCSAVDYALANGNTEIGDFLSGLKSPPFISFKVGEDLLRFLTSAVQEACCGAVWRVEKTIREDEAGNWPSLETILESGIGPFNNTLLHLAVDKVRDNTDPAGQVCRALLWVRADPTLFNKCSETPLHGAAYAANKRLYRMLSDAARRKLCDEEGGAGSKDLEVLLTKSIQRKELKKMLREKSDDDDLWLKAGFMGFRLVVMQKYVDRERERNAVSWYELLHKNRASLRGLDLTGQGADEDVRKPYHMDFPLEAIDHSLSIPHGHTHGENRGGEVSSASGRKRTNKLAVQLPLHSLDEEEEFTENGDGQAFGSPSMELFPSGEHSPSSRDRDSSRKRQGRRTASGQNVGRNSVQLDLHGHVASGGAAAVSEAKHPKAKRNQSSQLVHSWFSSEQQAGSHKRR